TVAASGDSKKARSRRTTGFVANVTIVIEPVGHHGRFRACVDGRVIVASTRQPFLDAARVLIGEGHDRRTILEMRRAGADQVSLHGPLWAAAHLDVKDTKFVKHRPRRDVRAKADASLAPALER